MSIAKLTFFNKIFYQVVIFGIEANYLVRLQKSAPGWAVATPWG